jgi:hypothetical protein
METLFPVKSRMGCLIIRYRSGTPSIDLSNMIHSLHDCALFHPISLLGCSACCSLYQHNVMSGKASSENKYVSFPTICILENPAVKLII